MKTTSRLTAKKNQQGSALIIVVILLLLATLILVFAVNLGVLTQRSSGNDLRSRLVQQTADSALSQASETILADDTILADTVSWELCDAADTSFPCGVIPAARRASMYRYIGGTQNPGVFEDTDVDNRMLDLTNKFTAVNNTAGNVSDGFDINYGVGVVMCRLTPAVVGVAPSCSTDADDQIRVYAVTLVAVAAMPDEGARATAVRSFATNATFGLGADTPPIVASGTITLRGNLQIVTSPNAAGPGVPVSVWTRTGMDSGGTPDTCYADEFYRSNTPAWYPAGTPGAILRCDDCDCGVGPLTQGSGASCTGGSDILANPSECGPSPPDNVAPDEFPCDLFQHVFGVQAWKDVDGDFFCETRITTKDPTNANAQIGMDEYYLAEKADWILKSNTTFDLRFAGDPRVINCNQLAGKSGLIWDRTGACGDGIEIGTPTQPALLVSDGTPSLQNTQLFGLLFVRSTGAGPLSASTGGDAEIKFNAQTAIYGSVIVQGIVDKGNGTAAVVHNKDVLNNLIKNLSKPDVIALPGSWSDNVRY